MYPVKLIVIGAGCRGTGYAGYYTGKRDEVQVIGVAEPRDFYRNRLAEIHQIPKENVYPDWKELVNRDKFADAVIIATQDKLHTEPAIAFANKKYHILLEKPMAPTADECRRITDAAIKNKIIFGVCHVMRYTLYTQKIKEIVDSGAIGDIVSIQHLEPVGYWHQAHSFVRGNWRNEAESSFMLLAKSCHDMDWLRYMIGKKCVKVSSFGTLKHFRKEEKPKDAGDSNRCVDCVYEPKCPYSAIKIYIGRVKRNDTGWPVDVLTPDTSIEGVMKSLREGPYGRCVYECDNDVVDNQVVNLQFAGGETATFTITAFNIPMPRKTRIFGARGELYGDGNKIEHYDFLTDKLELIDLAKVDGSILGGHGGGDYRLMKTFVDAVANTDPKKILSGPEETLESHLIVFAAEKSRRENRIVNL